MKQELVDELNYEKDILIKSGFYSTEEILEILEDLFFDENIDLSKVNVVSNSSTNKNFNKLEEVFTNLSHENIIGVHNCGYDVKEGAQDIFELYIHLKNNKFNPKGFCFYTFNDIEQAINTEKLTITFGDFENNVKTTTEIGKKVASSLEQYFNIHWDGTNQIDITKFKWDKTYNPQKDYEIEGAYETFTKVNKN